MKKINVSIFIIIILLACNSKKNKINHKEFQGGIYSATKLPYTERFVFSKKFKSDFNKGAIIAVDFAKDSTFRLFQCGGKIKSTGNWRLNKEKDSITFYNRIGNTKFHEQIGDTNSIILPDQSYYFRDGYLFIPYPQIDSLKTKYPTFTTVLKKDGEFFDTVTMKAENK